MTSRPARRNSGRPRGTFILIVLIASLLTGCSALKNVPILNISEAPDDTSENLATIDPSALTADYQAQLAKAETAAKEWQPDATLRAVAASWPSTLPLASSKQAYIFGSPNLPTTWWVYSYHEGNDERLRSEIPRSDYLGPDLPELPRQFWQLNAVEALQQAEKAGGAAFRESNPGAEVTASLSVQGPKGWLWWLVSYRGLNDSQLTVRVHPSTGDLYDDEGNLLSSDEGTESTSRTIEPVGEGTVE